MNRIFLSILLMSSGLIAFAQDSYIEKYSNALDLMNAQEFVNAIEMFERVYEAAPVKSQERSKALWGKGLAYYRIAQNQNLSQNYEESYRHYEEAMKCFRRVKRDKDVMDCAKSMAIMNSRHFGFSELAIEQLDYAYEIADKLELPEEQIEILDEKMLIYSNLHDESKRNAMNVKIDSIISTNSTLELQVKTYLKRGDNAKSNGDIDIALSYYNKARKANMSEDNEYFIYQKLRDAYLDRGDIENALKFSHACVDVWKRQFEGDISQKYLIYTNHCHIQMKAGDLSGALSSLDSLQNSFKDGGSDIERAQLMIDKGYVLMGMKNFGQAVSILDECDRLLSGMPGTVATLEKQRMLIPLYAAVLYQNKDYCESKIQYLRHIESVKTAYGEKSMEYSEAILNLANIEGYLGELDKGAKHYIESWNIARGLTCQDLQFLPSNARGKYWQNINELMWHMAPYAIKAQFQENTFTSAAYEALIFSKGLLLSLDKTTGKSVKESGDSQLIEDFMAVANIRNEIERQRSLKNGDEVMRLYASMDSLDRNLSIRINNAGISPTIASVTTSDITEKLKVNEAVIDFTNFIKADGSHIYAAFIVRKNLSDPRLIKVFEQSSLDSLIQENYGRFSDIYNNRTSGRLFDIVLGPIMQELDGIDTVYYVPSGIVNQLSLEAIRLPDGEYFSDRYEVVRLSNSKELISSGGNSVISDFETARLYGGLEYDVNLSDMQTAANEYPVSDLLALRSGTENMTNPKGFDKLKMSLQEVIEINDILTQSNINVTSLMATHGTEESFVSMSGNSPDLLLVSTHGFYYSPEKIPSWSSLNGYDNPMYLTGLVMSGGNAEYMKKDIPEGVMGGLLTSSDIARLDLSGTQMVVLSACETALGETTNEGVYGLQRAFKQSGAGTLVMSLWPVSDLATKEFITTFHREMAANGWDKRAAFKRARTLLREKYNSPYYWAAFIMVD